MAVRRPTTACCEVRASAEGGLSRSAPVRRRKNQQCLRGVPPPQRASAGVGRCMCTARGRSLQHRLRAINCAPAPAASGAVSSSTMPSPKVQLVTSLDAATWVGGLAEFYSQTPDEWDVQVRSLYPDSVVPFLRATAIWPPCWQGMQSLKSPPLV